MIANKTDFSDLVLPRYFRSAYIVSFIRQLNNYGFVIETMGNQIRAYNQFFTKELTSNYTQICIKDSMKSVSKDDPIPNQLLTRVLLLPACKD